MIGSASFPRAFGGSTAANEAAWKDREIAAAKADADAFIAKMTTALAILRRWVEDLEAAEKSEHWRTQPREPAGVPEGGQWTDGPYSGSDGGDHGADFALWLRTGRRPVLAQARPGWRDPWPQSPVSAQFRAALAARESRGWPNDGYGAINVDRDGHPVLGRYQFNWITQMQLGLRNADGSWNAQNGYGVRSEEDFLANPLAQERALANYVATLESQLRWHRATQYVRRQILGVRGEAFSVTMPGLVAAAHRGGARGVANYLSHLRALGWSSRGRQLPAPFAEIETRLREFERIQHRRARRTR